MGSARYMAQNRDDDPNRVDVSHLWQRPTVYPRATLVSEVSSVRFRCILPSIHIRIIPVHCQRVLAPSQLLKWAWPQLAWKSPPVKIGDLRITCSLV